MIFTCGLYQGPGNVCKCTSIKLLKINNCNFAAGHLHTELKAGLWRPSFAFSSGMNHFPLLKILYLSTSRDSGSSGHPDLTELCPLETSKNTWKWTCRRHRRFLKNQYNKEWYSVTFDFKLSNCGFSPEDVFSNTFQKTNKWMLTTTQWNNILHIWKEALNISQKVSLKVFFLQK